MGIIKKYNDASVIWYLAQQFSIFFDQSPLLFMAALNCKSGLRLSREHRRPSMRFVTVKKYRAARQIEIFFGKWLHCKYNDPQFLDHQKLNF